MYEQKCGGKCPSLNIPRNPRIISVPNQACLLSYNYGHLNTIILYTRALVICYQNVKYSPNALIKFVRRFLAFA